jgi:hypothetical protein
MQLGMKNQLVVDGVLVVAKAPAKKVAFGVDYRY